MAAVILASASASRSALLRNAGVDITVLPASIDEEEVKRAMRADGAAASDVAETLAELKATRIAQRHPDAVVVGADQMLVVPPASATADTTSELWLDKPRDRDGARQQLLTLRGRVHELYAAAVVMRAGARTWHTVAHARLTVRPFSDSFLDGYLDDLGEDACTSVGAYQLEGRGAQLFERVEGDFFTVLGLPLLPLLGHLRQTGVLRA